VSRGSAIRGTRVGSGPGRPTERGDPAPCRLVRYFCANGHSIEVRFAAEASTPSRWECARCGLPAGLDPDNPPERPRVTPYKSHLAYVKERRTDEDARAILAEALAALRQRRGD